MLGNELCYPLEEGVGELEGGEGAGKYLFK